MGDSSIHDDEVEEVKKKTKVPVIICIVCAIICLIATALILFIIPSKYNLISKKQSEDKKTELVEINPVPAEEEKTPQVQPEPDPVPEPINEPEPDPVPQAKEDEVIVIEQAEEVVPVPPEPVKEEKPADVKYKIKWGDTLWDIADTYYKNPWRYKKIARYNGIKNPDYIISGTVILIPVE
ncbi:MAG: LysM peptidoglycan-binding domain-containing protein [Treponema sp.]|nr:LysM peptidoglycan-binding domain-containing protein [Treponema sp.]